MSFRMRTLLAAAALFSTWSFVRTAGAAVGADEKPMTVVAVQVTGRGEQKQIAAYFATEQAASLWLASHGVPADAKEFVPAKVQKAEVAPRPPGPRAMPPRDPSPFNEATNEVVRKQVNEENAAPQASARELPEDIWKVDVTKLIPPHIAELANEFDPDERERTSSYNAACYFAGIGPKKGYLFDKDLLKILATRTNEVEKPQSGDIGLLYSLRGKPQIPFAVLFPDESDHWIFVKHSQYRVPFRFQRLSQMLRGLESSDVRYYRPRRPSKATVSYQNPDDAPTAPSGRPGTSSERPAR